MTEHRHATPSLRLIRVSEALSDTWPDTRFVTEQAGETLNVTWVDGPGRRAVLNEARLGGWGTSPMRATRSLTPAAMLSLLRSGVPPRELPNMPAPEPLPRDRLALGRLEARRLDTQKVLIALARLRDDELDIAVTLASDDPNRPLHEVIRAARALAAGDRECRNPDPTHSRDHDRLPARDRAV